MIGRVVIVALVVGLAFAAVWLSERRTGRRRAGIEPGMVLVTAPGCGLCPAAERALQVAGMRFRTVDASDVPDLDVKSVPTLFLVDDRGRVVRRRSGRSAVLSPAELAGWM